MTELFLHFVNVSISACWIVLAAVLFRLIFKKAPKWISVMMWGVVALRLVMPFSISSALSLVPSVETVSPQIMYTAEPTITSGISFVNAVVNPIIIDKFAPTEASVVNPLQHLIPTLAVVWLAGIVLMLTYMLGSYLRIRIKLKSAVRLYKNVWQSENVKTPFVLGVFRPRIYIPFGMDEKAMTAVINHENAHIKRLDHVIKPVAFILLSLYWFNPVMWVAYVLLCRDIEYACDERVIKSLDEEQRADYSEVMLALSAPRKMITACPIAFGEVGVKERVKRVLSYKKPFIWIIIAALVACAVTAVVLLTDPKDPSDDPTWPELEDIIENYTPEQAMADGCVVVDGGNVLYGMDIWADFFNKTHGGVPAKVRVYQEYTSQDSTYYVKEISFDGEKFRCKHYDLTGDTNELFLFDKEYDYLIKSYFIINDFIGEYYILSDNKDANIQDYMDHMLSSIGCDWTVNSTYTSDYPEIKIIFSRFVDSESFSKALYGVAYVDIDGDGEVEELRMGPGSTSGVMSFGIIAYSGTRIRYFNFFVINGNNYPEFIIDADGKTKVRISYGEDVRVYDIIIKNNNIMLEPRDENIESYVFKYKY